LQQAQPSLQQSSALQQPGISLQQLSAAKADAPLTSSVTAKPNITITFFIAILLF
jgi:hypothetical protein